jgi:hypothetical protein
MLHSGKATESGVKANWAFRKNYNRVVTDKGQISQDNAGV